MKKTITVLIITSMLLMLSSCSFDIHSLHKWFPNIIEKETTTSKDTDTHVTYNNAEEFEEALNSGEDVTGDIVSFTVKDVVYAESEGNFNIYKAGEHLNFISDRKIDTEAGMTMVVEVTQFSMVNDEYWTINFTIPT